MKVIVVGYGPVGSRVVRLLETRGYELFVFDEDPERAGQARHEGVEVFQDLVTSRGSSEVVGDADAFVLMDIDPLRVDHISKHFRRRYPGARIIASDVAVEEFPYLETFTGDGQALRVGVEAIANAVVSAVEDHVAKRSTDRLVEVLRSGGDGEVAIFAHDDPDPDAIASAMGMLRLCQELDLEAKAYHGGGMNRLENRFFATLVGSPLASVTPEEAAVVVEAAGRVVLLDAGVPGVNNVLPPSTVPNVVLDHHSTNADAAPADLTDVRPNVGSTATMVTGHLQRLGVVPDAKLAAALLFGIRTDTDHLRRNAFPADVRAAAYLASLADQELLDLVEHPPLTPQVMNAIGRGILARRREGDHLFTWCGQVGSREDLPPVAEFLLQEEDVAAVFVLGRVDDRVHLSARSVVGGPHVGDIVKRALAEVGSGGGHPNLAGGVVHIRTGVGLDVDSWVEGDIFQALIEAAGVATERPPRAG